MGAGKVKCCYKMKMKRANRSLQASVRQKRFHREGREETARRHSPTRIGTFGWEEVETQNRRDHHQKRHLWFYHSSVVGTAYSHLLLLSCPSLTHTEAWNPITVIVFNERKSRGGEKEVTQWEVIRAWRFWFEAVDVREKWGGQSQMSNISHMLTL